VPNRCQEFQKQLIVKWRTLQTTICEVQARIATHEEELVTEVLRASGIRINIPPARPKAYALPLDEMDRWGVGFNRETWTLQDILATNLFPRVPLCSVARVNPGRTKAIVPNSLVSFVPMEAVSETSGTIEDMEEALVEEVSRGYTTFEEGDLIWAKITPCMQNGKSAVARSLKNGVGFGSTEFHVIRPRSSAMRCRLIIASA
jgi:type I restriction enzyme S subunit